MAIFAANGTSAVMLHDDGHRANDPSFARATVLNLSFSIISAIKYFDLGQGQERIYPHGILVSEKITASFPIFQIEMNRTNYYDNKTVWIVKKTISIHPR